MNGKLPLLLTFCGLFLAITPAERLYHYRAEVASIYDGDTIRADMDLGLGIWKKNEPLRLFGIDAPELRGIERELGLKSRDHLQSILMKRELIVESIKDKKGKYGRILAILWVKGVGVWCPKDNWCNVNDQMVKDKQAIYKEY